MLRAFSKENTTNLLIESSWSAEPSQGEGFQLDNVPRSARRRYVKDEPFWITSDLDMFGVHGGIRSVGIRLARMGTNALTRVDNHDASCGSTGDTESVVKIGKALDEFGRFFDESGFVFLETLRFAAAGAA